MLDQLIDTWRIHQSKNVLLVQNISAKGMICTLSSRGGRNIFQQWVHIHNVRKRWLDVCAKDISGKCILMDKEKSPDQTDLLRNLEQSAGGIEELLVRSWSNSGVIKGFKKGSLPFLGYMIAHESHHRGNIMLTLKQCGEKIPDSVKWDVWEWNK